MTSAAPFVELLDGLAARYKGPGLFWRLRWVAERAPEPDQRSAGATRLLLALRGTCDASAYRSTAAAHKLPCDDSWCEEASKTCSARLSSFDRNTRA